jgi:hypothetical protein
MYLLAGGGDEYHWAGTIGRVRVTLRILNTLPVQCAEGATFTCPRGRPYVQLTGARCRVRSKPDCDRFVTLSPDLAMRAKPSAFK